MTATLDGEIRDGRHQMQVRVYFEDTDAGQIVYHANFLRFMERGRTNYLRLLGTNQHALLQEARNDAPGFTFVVRSMTIDFLKPAVLDDVLDAVTIPQEVRGASIALLQQCRRADDILITAVYAWHLSQAEKRSASRRRCGLLWKGIDQPTPHSRLSRPATQ